VGSVSAEGRRHSNEVQVTILGLVSALLHGSLLVRVEECRLAYWVMRHTCSETPSSQTSLSAPRTELSDSQSTGLTHMSQAHNQKNHPTEHSTQTTESLDNGTTDLSP
jgi:hypothetical protein